jgi:cysteinyl-tRNA synthetase
MQDYFHYNVSAVMNITDIDDKLIARAQENGNTSSTRELAKFWEADFKQDMLSLNVRYVCDVFCLSLLFDVIFLLSVLMLCIQIVLFRP